MSYYIGCCIPRVSDCDNNVKCLKGLYCKSLKVLSTETHGLRYTSLGDKKCVFFENIEDAQNHLSNIKIDNT